MEVTVTAYLYTYVYRILRSSYRSQYSDMMHQSSVLYDYSTCLPKT